MDATVKLSNILEQQGIIAASPHMKGLYQNALHLSNNDATILLHGESGAGKDRVAKFIHENSPRSNAPFIQINCSAIPENLFESEVFGYESGTFTGALSVGKRGLLETADGGTIFLDEIGEMSLPNQVKLLDFLQHKQVTRLGGSERKTLDVRIISATNRDLWERIHTGEFREDLYYRICVVILYLPPLRERVEDIAALALRFVSQVGAEHHPHTLTEDAIAYLQSLDWPGNVRQLHNFIERVCILEGESSLTGAILERHYHTTAEVTPPDSQVNGQPPLSLKEAVRQFERAFICTAISETATLAEAARRLNIDLDTLNRKKKQLGIYKRWHKSPEQNGGTTLQNHTF